jgi:integrase
LPGYILLNMLSEWAPTTLIQLSLRITLGPHRFRRWFTTWLLRNGMPREYVKELRGDKRGEAIDIYHHIDRQELRKAYLAYIPKLGV